LLGKRDWHSFPKFKRQSCGLSETDLHHIAFFMNGVPDFIDLRRVKFHRLVADRANRKCSFESKV
jgi:hypothetical protein